MDLNLTLYLNTTKLVKAGDDVSVICNAYVNKTLIDVDVDIEMQLVGPRGTSTTKTFGSTNTDFHELNIILPNISAEYSGQYKCNATIKTSSASVFSKPGYKEEFLDLRKLIKKINNFQVSCTIAIYKHPAQLSYAFVLIGKLLRHLALSTIIIIINNTLQFITLNLITEYYVPQVEISHKGEPIAGHRFVLLCRVTRDPYLSGSVEVEWLGPGDMLIEELSGVTVIGPSGSTNGSFIRSLVFNNLHTSHGGIYTCRVNLTGFEQNIISHLVNTSFDVIVRRT